MSAGGSGDIDGPGGIDGESMCPARSGCLTVSIASGRRTGWPTSAVSRSRPGNPNDPAVCPFDVIPTRPDADALIVARGVLTYAVLNLYPYNAGHLLVVPYRHVPDITDLDVDEAAEFMAFTQRAITMIRAVSSAQGFNVGMNLGFRRGRGDCGPPASARRPAVGRRHQLHADRRAHQGVAAVTARHAGTVRCCLAAGLTF